MASLTIEQLEGFQRRLRETEKKVLELILQTAEEAKPVDLDLPIGRLSRMDAIQMQSMAQQTRRHLDIRLQQIRVALSAMRDGSYGTCRKCRCEMSLERIETRPEAPFCLSCQESFESE